MILKIKEKESNVGFLRKSVKIDDITWFLAYTEIIQLLTNFEFNIDCEERAKIGVDADVVIPNLTGGVIQ